MILKFKDGKKSRIKVTSFAKYFFMYSKKGKKHALLKNKRVKNNNNIIAEKMILKLHSLY